MKLKLLSIGKTKESWLEEAIGEYLKRLPCPFEFHLFKDRPKLVEAAQKERRLILLDPQGDQLTSEAFSKFLIKEIELGGATACFVIGDADGLPPELKGSKISLSKLTFTHQMARLILLEQVFRAFEIDRGSPYHK